MTGNNSISRRGFLKATAATAVAFPSLVPAGALGRDAAVAPSDRIVLGAIGLGFAWDMGLGHPEVRLAAVCDVQSARREAGKDIYCQEPLTHTFRHAAELVLNGYIGKLHTIRLGVPSGRVSTARPARLRPCQFPWA